MKELRKANNNSKVRVPLTINTTNVSQIMQSVADYHANTTCIDIHCDNCAFGMPSCMLADERDSEIVLKWLLDNREYWEDR